MSEQVPITDEAFARQLNKMGGATIDQIEKAQQVKVDAEKAGKKTTLASVLISQGIITPAIRDNVEKGIRAAAQGGLKQLGNYKLLKKLGEGGMGAVYLAEDTMAGRKVALKVLPKKHSGNSEFITRFRREAKSTGKLNHVNIVTAYAVGEELGNHYYAMEYCEGDPLDDVLRKKGTLPWDEAVGITIQVARGLKHAIEHGIIHRDIKPANVFITKEGVAKILDLGLSKNILEAESSFNTQTGMALGTPHYISPEQARGDKVVDSRSDIYSLGATLYQLVTGQTPFSGSSAALIMMKHLTEQIPNPIDINEDLPEGVATVVQKMMAKEPEDRYANYDTLLADLELVIDGKSPSSHAIDDGKSSVAMAQKFAAPRRGAAPAAQKRAATAQAKVDAHKPAPARAKAKPQNKTAMHAGIAGGAVAVVLACVVAFGGGRKKDDDIGKGPPSPPPVAQIEKNGPPKSPPVAAKAEKPAAPIPPKKLETPSVIPANQPVEKPFAKARVGDWAEYSSKMAADGQNISYVSRMTIKNITAKEIVMEIASTVGGKTAKQEMRIDANATDGFGMMQQMGVKLPEGMTQKEVQDGTEEMTVGSRKLQTKWTLQNMEMTVEGKKAFETSKTWICPDVPWGGMVKMVMTGTMEMTMELKDFGFGPNTATSGAASVNFKAFNAEPAGQPMELFDQPGTSVFLPKGFKYQKVCDVREPMDIDFSPDGIMWIAARDGIIRTYSFEKKTVHQAGKVAGTVNIGGERGMHGILCHPEFKDNHSLFVYYTADGPNNVTSNRLSVLTVRPSADGYEIVPNSEKILLENPSLHHRHQGGSIKYNPRDRKIYVTVGDNNDPPQWDKYFGDEKNQAQDLSKLQGKVLRLNLDGSIPPDNPFVGKPNARGEIFTYGHRNPYSMNIDPETGAIYLGEMGYDRKEDYDEINLLKSGGNYGWPLREGPASGKLAGNTGDKSLIDPWLYYTRENGAAASSGPVYRRNNGAYAFPADFDGAIFYADYFRKWVRYVRTDKASGSANFAAQFAMGIKSGILSVVQGPDGALYLVEHPIGITRIVYEVDKSAAAPVEKVDDPARWAKAVDLIPLLDTNQDGVTGNWQIQNGDLISENGNSLRVQFPYKPPAEYDYRLEYTIKSGAVDVTTILFAGGKEFDFKNGAVGRPNLCAFDEINGQKFLNNPSTTTMPFSLKVGERTVSMIQVRKDSISAYINGQLVLTRKTDYSEFNQPKDKALRDLGRLGLVAWGNVTVFHSVKVLEVNGKGTFIRPLDAAAKEAEKKRTGEAENIDDPARWAKAVDLIPAIQPESDKIAGNWKLENGELLSERFRAARIELPYQPPAEYDYRIEFTTDNGCQVNQFCSRGGKAFSWIMGSFGNSFIGLEMVKGLGANDPGNPTALKRKLIPKQRYVSIAQVRNGSVRVFLDGEKVADYATDFSDLSILNPKYPWWKLRDEKMLALGTDDAPTKFHKIQVLEVSGKGSLTRTAEAVANNTGKKADEPPARQPGENPYKSANVGDWVEMEMQFNLGNSIRAVRGKFTVVRKTDKEAVVELATRENGVELKKQETIDFAKPFISLFSVESGKGRVMQTSNEDIIVNRRTLKTTATVTESPEVERNQPIKVMAKSNYSAEVPLEGFVYVDVRRNNGTKEIGKTLLKLLDFGFGPKTGSVKDPEKKKTGAAETPPEKDLAAALFDSERWKKSIDLLPLINLKNDAVLPNEYFYLNGVMQSSHSAGPILVVPYRPPAEYDYLIEFTPLDKQSADEGAVCICHCGANNGCVFYIKNGSCELSWDQNGRVEGLPSSANVRFKAGQRVTAILQVRRDSLKGYVDGALVVEGKTNGPREPERLELLPQSCAAKYHRLQVIEISGKGKFERPQDTAAKAAEKKRSGGVVAAEAPVVEDPWIKSVQAVPAPKQLEMVAAELVKLNPGFPPTAANMVAANDRIVEFSALSRVLKDISPVRALIYLQKLTIGGELHHNAPLADLTPLSKLKLTYLDCNYASLTDLSPLTGMPLTTLYIPKNPKLANLTPLAGMPLTSLSLMHTAVSNLAPLKGMKLEDLNCYGIPITDLSALEGMPLVTLNITKIPATDLSSLKKLPALKSLHYDLNIDRDSAILKAIPTLEKINDQPVATALKR